MNKKCQGRQRQVVVGAIGGSLLMSLPAIAMPQLETEQLAQTNPNPTILQEAPYNRSESTTPLNPNPNIFNEPPYNRSRPSTLR